MSWTYIGVLRRLLYSSIQVSQFTVNFFYLPYRIEWLLKSPEKSICSLGQSRFFKKEFSLRYMYLGFLMHEVANFLEGLVWMQYCVSHLLKFHLRIFKHMVLCYRWKFLLREIMQLIFNFLICGHHFLFLKHRTIV